MLALQSMAKQANRELDFLCDHRPPGHSEEPEVTGQETSRANTVSSF